jgi:hypothetical protein
MNLGEIVELVFGLVVLAFMLYFIIIVPIAFINDSSKPRYRRRRRTTYRKYGTNWKESRDFEYTGSYNSSEFLVYFIENEDLNALKVGVGTGGRLLQLLNSYASKNSESKNIGWKVLKVAKFTDVNSDYILDKIYGEQAEKKAHYYWRYVLKLPIHLEQDQLGYSKVKEFGNTHWVLTKGYTETVEKNKVCEVSTWNFIKQSPGFIEEIPNFMGYESRELKILHPEHLLLSEPPGYPDFKLQRVNHFKDVLRQSQVEKTLEEKFWEKVDKDSSDCWLWTGAVTKKEQQNSYAIFSHEGRNQLAQRVAWALEGLEKIDNSTLENLCGNKRCVKPEHWAKSLRRRNSNGEKRISSFKCTNKKCNRPSETFTKATLCEPCRQKVKRVRRKIRSNLSVENLSSLEEQDLSNLNSISVNRIGKISIYQCISKDCTWPSSSMFESAYCEICKKKMSKN